MDSQAAREFFDRLVRAMNDRDLDELQTFFADDFVDEYPQSGERIRGWRNLKATLENYPQGGPRSDSQEIAAARVVADDRWVMTPSFTVVRVTGSGDTHTYVLKTRYPDGSDWYMINIVELRGGKIQKGSSFFAPAFPAPQWRGQWVESMDAAAS
ncbi:MAG: nuclear transport factor 2 family protein [Chloroflexi bacterium]|nr:nuclear transport factor 2 family protein [Chloroflexota bacterium]